MPYPVVTINSEEARKIALAAVEDMEKVDPKRGAVCVVGRDGMCATLTAGSFCSIFKDRAEEEAALALQDNKYCVEDFGDGSTLTCRILTTEESAEELVGAIAISGHWDHKTMRGICSRAAKSLGFFVDG